MTRVVAQVVYQLDMDELPLKKLERTQNKNQARGRSRSSAADMYGNRRKTFSHGLLIKAIGAGKSHPVLPLQRSGSYKREKHLPGGTSASSASHRSVNPTTKLTCESQLGDLSCEPLLEDSMISLVSDSPMERQSSTSSQQLLLDSGGRRGSEPTTSTADHPSLSQVYSAPTASSNTYSPLATHSPLVQAEYKAPWAGNESPVRNTSTIVEQQSMSAFVSPLPTNDFILENEHADIQMPPTSINEDSLSGSRRTSENSCTTPEPRRHNMMKALSVDDTRHKLINENTNNRLLPCPDSFSSDILPDRSGSIKVRRAGSSAYREQSYVIHEERAVDADEKPATGDFFIRMIIIHCIL